MGETDFTDPTAPRIEPARECDLPRILEIMNAEIDSGWALWKATPRSLAQIRAWRAERLAGAYPMIVARVGGEVAGYGSYGPFRPSEGYRDAVEHSLYVARRHQRRGVGRALLEALEAEARAQGVWVMIGGVEAGNAASIALHERLGFQETARMPEVGVKHGRRLTLVLMQKILRGASNRPAAG